MDQALVTGVRRFNRLVTRRVGALDERHLERNRPLGQARVLWEIGRGGCEVGVLRARLGLDSAQLSRSLRALEQDGLITVVAHERDTRVRFAALTAAGVSEWGELDAASDKAALAILGPLSRRQRDQLLEAMGGVERLLMASLIEIEARAPSDPLARVCLRSYRSEIEARFGMRFDLGSSDDQFVPPDGLFLVAILESEPVGCGALKVYTDGPPEIKRLWTAPTARGIGLGRRLLTELERAAAASGATTVRLDTNRSLIEAIALYRSTGYEEIARYNDNPYAHHLFEKDLQQIGAPNKTATDP
jgi:DNA-binding MarR family transcriptional regulator/GNAT superfamily N-acetyltransferase